MKKIEKQIGCDLTENSVLKVLLIFAIPIVLTNLIQQLYSMVDLMVIGHFAGNIGTVAVSTGGEISDFLTPVATHFATAGQILIAQLVGAKLVEKQKRAIGSFISMMIMISVVFMLLTIVFREQILRLLNCPPEAFSQAESYMIITAVGLPFIYGYNAVCGILRGMGESKNPMLFVVIAAIINVFLDLLLVVVIPMEAVGTAIATVMSQIGAFIAAFIYMYRYKDKFGMELNIKFFRLDKEATNIILGLGIPMAVRSILVRFSMLWVNASVNGYGLVASGTNSVGNKLLKFLEIFSSSLTQAGGAMVGQNLGAEKHKRARDVVYYTLASCLVVTVFISVIVFCYPKAVFGIFTKDTAILDMGVVYLNIMIIHFFTSAFTGSFQCMVIGSGNSMLNFIIGILDGIVCKIGIALFLVNVFHMGVYGYFWASALSRVLPGIICMVYFYKGDWKKRKLVS